MKPALHLTNGTYVWETMVAKSQAIPVLPVLWT